MTLWDKEDMAVRMVLEEGKLNMCLRVLQGAHGTGTRVCPLRWTLSSRLTSVQSTKPWCGLWERSQRQRTQRQCVSNLLSRSRGDV
jgi:hypothetical protein